MKLDHIPLDKLTPSKLNVRKHGGKQVDDLTASIRTHGLLQPLLVRPHGEGFEIVAGQRRYHACRALAAEGSADEPLPCLVMQAGDDAAAIEASLAENIARLPMDEIDQYRAFAALIAKGRSAEEVADHFGVTERLVRQRLAIAGLYAPILSAYRREEIDPATLRALTLASTRQQKAWWARFRDPEDYAPHGHALRAWLFGGRQIPTTNALFDLSDYDGAIIADLFGEESYFSDSEQFWRLQSKAVAERKERYLADGWQDVVLCEVGQFWPQWEHASTTKEDGGKVFITFTADGEVTAHEGFLPHKEAERRQHRDEDAAAPERPECTKAMQNYLALHRHAAVRTRLTAAPDVALRLMLAHIIAGSRLWQVDADPQKAAQESIRESLTASKAETAFAEERRAVAALLGLDEEGEAPHSIASHLPPYQAQEALPDLFARLLELSEPEVQRILAFLMAETLQAGGEIVETLGALLLVDMADWWQPDETFFVLLRDKQAINGMVAELAGKDTATAHCTATATVQKGILKDCLSGTRQPRVTNWLPGYMSFPMRGYTGREVMAA